MQAAGFLSAVLVHELFHALMAEGYGNDYLKLKALADPFARHDSPVVTDSATALIEGLAEAAEVALEQEFPGQVYANHGENLTPAVRDFARQLQRKRLTQVERQRYLFQSDGRVKDGQLDSAKTLMHTEGVVASLTVALLPHLGAKGGLGPLVETLVRRRPRSFPGLIRSLHREIPEAGLAVQRTLLEFTRYSLFSRRAAPRYRRAYLARKKYLRGELSRARYQAEKLAWATWRARQRKRIEEGATPMAVVAPALEILTNAGTQLDLNGTPEEVLAGMESLLREGNRSSPELSDPRNVTALVLQLRRRRGGRFGSLRDLRGKLPEALLVVLEEGASRFRSQAEVKLEGISSRLRARRLQDAFVIPDPRFQPDASREASDNHRD
jgi:hypothetical protein